MTSNLHRGLGNTYWTVTAPFDAYVQVALTGSHTHVGRAEVCGTVWRKVTVARGQQVHALVGGTFIVIEGVRYDAAVTLNEAHPFERNAGPAQVWPLACLRQVGRPAFTPTRNTPAEVTLARAATIATPIGRGVDWLETPGTCTTGGRASPTT